MIETIEKSPDTKIMTTTGKMLIVSDSPDEIKKRIVEFYRTIYREKFEGLDE